MSRRIIPFNHALYQELVDKGFIIPEERIAKWLRSKGYYAAAEAQDKRMGRYE